MAPVASDAHLWIAVAVLGWCSALAIYKQLALVRNISEVAESPPPSDNKIYQQVQDGTIFSSAQTQDMAKSASSAIQLSTLSELLQSTSLEIRAATTDIVTKRALQSPTVWKMLCGQLRSKTDLKARDEALCILVQFGPGSKYDMHARKIDPRILETNEFIHPDTFKACVACLRNMLPAARQADYLRQHHNSAEADALWLARLLFEINVGLALEAGFVSEWLVDYPFDVRFPGMPKSEAIGEIIKEYEYDDDYQRLLICLLQDMVESIEAVLEMQQCGIGRPSPFHNAGGYRPRHWGVRHLYAPFPWERRPWERRPRGGGGEGRGGRDVQNLQDGAALMPMDMSPTTSFRRTDDDVILVYGPDHASDFADEASSIWGDDDRREIPMWQAGEESDEERALRTRRREAMVFAEGGGPIRREDIFESPRRETSDQEGVE